MSQVREATTADGRLVAVKLPRRDCNRAAGRMLIHREFGFLGAISHPSIVAVWGLAHIPHPTSAEGNEPGIVMEHLGGGDLVSIAGASPHQWVHLAAQVARAVDDLHGAGIVHRDLKPRNVLLGSDDVPRLIDFALAAHIGGAVPVGGGTAAYQRDAPADEGAVADDVHAMAVLVYELWFGALPFGGNPGPQARKHWGGLPKFETPSGVRGLRRLAGVLTDVLAQRPAALYGGIGPLRCALQSVVIER